MTPGNVRPGGPRSLSASVRHSRKALCWRVEQAIVMPDAHFSGEFAHLLDAVEAAFRHEEVIMSTLGYARLREQQEENAVILSALHHVLPRVEDGDLGLGRQVLEALLEVLSLHRLSSGLALALSVRNPPLRVRGSASRATLHVATRPRHAR